MVRVSLYPLMVVPLCAPPLGKAAEERSPADFLKYRDIRYVELQSTPSPEVVVESAEFADRTTHPMERRTNIRAIVNQEIEEALKGAETFDERMDALERYIDENNRAISKWLAERGYYA